MEVEEIFRAYFDCRQNKRTKMTSLAFELNLESNLLVLYGELQSRSYEIGKSECFIIKEPKIREVWAANFRDRVVHHYIYNRISEEFYKSFINESYSCIPKKGTLAGAKRAEKFAREITKNYKEEAYCLKADISNFFVTIDKDILYKQIKEKVKDEFDLELLHQIIYNNPKEKVVLKATKDELRTVPYHKSLWNTPNEKGLPIGNLTSQFFSNVYLDKLDKFVKHKLRCKYYCRYVDDIILFDKDSKQLNSWYKAINNFLKTELKQSLHPNKKSINKVEKGFDFVGYKVKPNRIYIRQKTLRKIYKRIYKWRKAKDYSEESVESYIKTMNSYLGMLRSTDGYNLRRDICLKSINIFLSCTSDFKKLTKPTRYARI